MPTATEKLCKVTDATEIATTEVMNIVDNVINRLTNMSNSLDELKSKSEDGIDVAFLKGKTSELKKKSTAARMIFFQL